uniref:Abp4 n=1 Tax=Arundo donax TaxID=35708 RepID=A0A0A9EIW7_ARUDO
MSVDRCPLTWTKCLKPHFHLFESMSERAGDSYMRETFLPIVALVHSANVLHQRIVSWAG